MPNPTLGQDERRERWFPGPNRDTRHLLFAVVLSIVLTVLIFGGEILLLGWVG